MDRRQVLKGAAAVMATTSVGLAGNESRAQQASVGMLYDLSDPAQALDALVKMRGDLTGAEVAWYWSGGIWGMVPGEGNRKLFGYAGFSATRFEPFEEGYRMLNREAGVYRDPATGVTLASWVNPYLGREVEVLHRFNDHVNVEIRRQGRFSIAMIPAVVMGDDVFWNLDVFFFRPSPISRAEYPLNVQHDMYQGAEMTLYHARNADLQNPALKSAPARVTFTRISQWEPFMEMGNRPGQLVFHAAGKKLEAGAADLDRIDSEMRSFIVGVDPKYLRSPEVWQPGTISQWDAFKMLKDAASAD